MHALKAQGNAYPNDFRPNVFAAELLERFGEQEKEDLDSVVDRFAVAGRMMAKRVMGKIAFVRLQDGSGTIQLVVQRDNIAEGAYQLFKQWDVGDLIGGEGRIFRTQKRRVVCQG